MPAAPPAHHAGRRRPGGRGLRRRLDARASARSSGSILTYAAPTGSPGLGASLLFTYSLGLGIPFLLAGPVRHPLPGRLPLDARPLARRSTRRPPSVFIADRRPGGDRPVRGHHPAPLGSGVLGHLKIVSIVGNRPQFVKAAPLSRALRARGQRGARAQRPALRPRARRPLLRRARRAAARPRPGGGLGQPGGPRRRVMLQRLEPLLVAEAPDMVLVYGDTTTTLAGALAAAKLGLPARPRRGRAALLRHARCPRSRTAWSPTTSPTLLLCPTDAAVANLAREGITTGVHQVGDVMLDASRMFAPAAAARPGPAALGPRARRLPARHGPPGRGHRHARGARRAGRGAGGASTSPPSSRCTRAPATGSRRPAAGRAWRGTPPLRAVAAGRLPRLHRPAARRARRA